MSWSKVVIAVVALAAGVGLGSVLPQGTEAPQDVATSQEPAPSPSPTPSPTRAPPHGAELPDACATALSVAEETVRFLPEALSRLRAAYERANDGQAQGGGTGGPPPGPTFSQLQAQAESMTSRFLGARSSCETAASR